MENKGVPVKMSIRHKPPRGQSIYLTNKQWDVLDAMLQNALECGNLQCNEEERALVDKLLRKAEQVIKEVREYES